MKMVKEELRGAKGELESCRQKYDGMFSVKSPHKGCYVPFARDLYTPSNLIIIMFTSMQYTNQATCVVFINDM